jgi:hypothetical protein
MQAELRIRRAAAGGFVLLLHFVVLLALLAAFRPQLFQQTLGTREITVSLPVLPQTSERPPQQPSEIASPRFLVPESPRAITLPSLEAPPPPAAEQQPEGDIRALGRYLYNCTGLYYERLSAKEKAHCLEGKFNGQEGPALTLGPAKPSPYDAVIAGRNAPAVPIEKPCPADKPTANLGLPCFSFEGAHAPLVEFHH